MAEQEGLLEQLQKMTVKDLRKFALGIEGITGVHVMKKEELIDAIKDAKGIEDRPTEKIAAERISAMKRQVQELREKEEEAHDAGDKKRIKILQRKINRLKKKTRRAAA
jgi:hypothetical protein